MAAINCQKWSTLFCAVVVALSSLLPSTYGTVHEIPNKNSLEKFIKGKLFTLTFVDSHTCTRCRVLYPFFVAAAQIFPHDPEIFFTRTHNKQLVKEWGVTELPALVYHLEGLKSFQTLDIDITVDDIIETIARILHGNFGGLTRTYHVRVDDKVFDELLITPKQNAFLLLHDKKDREERTNIERVAYAFRKDDAILFATLDVSKYAGLRDERFKSRQTPVLMWFGAHEKDSPKRFGAVLSAELITKFVNERTGLHRDVQGTILSEAGRIQEVDEILRENIEDIVDADSQSLVSIASAISSLKGSVDEHHEQVLEYYMYVIDNIALAESTSVLQQLMRSEEDRLYGEEELSTKTKEVLKRRQNLLMHVQSLVDACKKDRSKRPQEVEDARLEKKKLRGNMRTEVLIEDTARPAHTHSEL